MSAMDRPSLLALTLGLGLGVALEMLRSRRKKPPKEAATQSRPSGSVFGLVMLRVIAPLFESTLLQTSWGGLPPPPNPPLLFRWLAEIELHPYLNHHFFERPISRETVAKYDIFGNLCNPGPCMSVCMHFFEHHRRSHPPQPSRCLLNSIAPFLESLHPYLGGLPPPPTPPLRSRFSTEM